MIIILLLSLKSFSQTSDSCECIPVSKLRLAAKKIEQGRLDSAELTVQRRNAQLFAGTINTYQNLVNEYKAKELDFKKIEATYQRDSASYLDQIGAANRAIDQLEKGLRHQKTGKKIIGGVGLVGIILALLLK